MKIRDGFVTNSSSTNFLIICKEDLTVEYLYKKLGFEEDSPIAAAARIFCEEIITGSKSGIRRFEVEQVDYDTIAKVYGEDSAQKYDRLAKKGYFTYMGCTRSDDSPLTSYLTMDHFIIDEEDFYMDGRDSSW
ncbi:MAG: hypothetical protein LBR44_07300 [Clostridiales Family XIII bacterium]|jgi:hypothetical protein|nr:hypothetical protein [Clostridiales Family XIII bacterium]